MKRVNEERGKHGPGGGWRLLLVVPSVLCAGISAAQPTAGLPPEYQVRNATVASSGGVHSADCYTIVSTVGEAVVGRVSAGTYTLTSGFPATIDATGDRLFRDGFELKSGECAP